MLLYVHLSSSGAVSIVRSIDVRYNPRLTCSIWGAEPPTTKRANALGPLGPRGPRVQCTFKYVYHFNWLHIILLKHFLKFLHTWIIFHRDAIHQIQNRNPNVRDVTGEPPKLRYLIRKSLVDYMHEPFGPRTSRAGKRNLWRGRITNYTIHHSCRIELSIYIYRKDRFVRRMNVEKWRERRIKKQTSADLDVTERCLSICWSRVERRHLEFE